MSWNRFDPKMLPIALAVSAFCFIGVFSLIFNTSSLEPAPENQPDMLDEDTIEVEFFHAHKNDNGTYTSETIYLDEGFTRNDVPRYEDMAQNVRITATNENVIPDAETIIRNCGYTNVSRFNVYGLNDNAIPLTPQSDVDTADVLRQAAEQEAGG